MKTSKTWLPGLYSLWFSYFSVATEWVWWDSVMIFRVYQHNHSMSFSIFAIKIRNLTYRNYLDAVLGPHFFSGLSLVLFKLHLHWLTALVCVCACTSYLVFPPQHLCVQQPRAVSMCICVGGMTLWSPSYTLASTTGISGCWLKPNPPKMFCTSFMYSTQPFPPWTVYEFTVRQRTQRTEVLSETHTHTHTTAFLRSIKCTIQSNLTQITHKQAIHLYRFYKQICYHIHKHETIHSCSDRNI